SLFSIFLGYSLITLFPEETDLNWRQSMSITAIIWLIYMFIGAIPLFLSGHYNSYLDACFESMSALATTGLVLVNDLDHMAHCYNFWRHFMCFIGGQGIILIGLIIFFKGTSAFKIYVGEGREEKILPNIFKTAKFIWFVSSCYLIIFTLVIGIINIFFNGFSPNRAFFHALCIFMAGWDTAGFAVQSQNINYYHNPLIEILTSLIACLGALNFGLHYSIWTGKIKEIFKNYELKVFLISITILTIFTFLVFSKNSSSLNFFANFRVVSYQLISSHTGVGYSNIDSFSLKNWPELSLIFLVIAMGFGGCSCSTSGGIKMLRIGLIIKEIKKEIKLYTSPTASIIIEKFHHLKDIELADSQVKTSSIILILFIFTYFLGSLIGTFYGYPFLYSIFESTSACANVGLSVGITNPSMPNLLKIVYIFEMYLGRLEFLSVFVFISYLFSLRSKE
ncbi:MAG: TrkH family potassium uptake protein, partial [Candidatus Omnitrophica bacterium]|nr:TrkH family potassium uptake protein [Candidatus Omnitrophota bacterium]